MKSENLNRPDQHIRLAVAALLVICVGLPVTAAADSAVIFWGGWNRADLGGDAELMGDNTAAGMQQELGGTWSSEQDLLGGIAVGAGYRLGLSKGIDLQLETQYIQRGTMYTLTGIGATNLPAEVEADLDLKLNFLEVAALAYLTPMPDAPVRLYVMGGPVIGFKTSSEIKVTAEGQSQSSDLDEGIAGTNFGLLGAGGLSLRFSRTTHLTFQARYFLGQTELLENIDGTKANDLTFLAGLELLD